MTKEIARAIADINKNILKLRLLNKDKFEAEKTLRMKTENNLMLTQQIITDLDIANIKSEQNATDTDLRLIALEVKNE